MIQGRLVKKNAPKKPTLKKLVAGLCDASTFEAAKTSIVKYLDAAGERVIPEFIKVITDELAQKEHVADEKKELNASAKLHDQTVKVLKDEILLNYVLTHGEAGAGTSRFLRCGEALVMVSARAGTKDGKLEIFNQKPQDYEMDGIRVTNLKPQTPDLYKRVVAQVTFPAVQIDEEVKHFIEYAKKRQSATVGFRVEGIEINTTKDSESAALRSLLDGKTTYGYIEITEDLATNDMTIPAGGIYKIVGSSNGNTGIRINDMLITVPAASCTPVEWCRLTYPKQISFKENKE